MLFMNIPVFLVLNILLKLGWIGVKSPDRVNCHWNSYHRIDALYEQKDGQKADGGKDQQSHQVVNETLGLAPVPPTLL
jgi:hypothetical protein